MKKQLINEVYRMQQLAGITPLYESLNEDEGQSVFTVQGSDDIGDIWTVCFKDKATYDTKQQAAENMLKDKHDLEELYLTTEVGTEDNSLTPKQKETLDKLGFVPTKVAHGKTVSNLEEDGNSGSINQDIDDTEQSAEDAPEKEDNWYAVSDDSFDNDKEPTGKDIKTTAGVDTSKQGKLIALQGKKDDVLAKLKSGQITIDQYKQEIGNIPQQIKNLQAAIEAELNVNDDEEEY